ncbi:NAD(P)-binding protein [Lojkania enalia]|uniref:NAD(P)-binding protein n=1 Tax=Lojkania enalia TaxID=147567 RepID=A0A9P4K3C0_9PLEO|nr:NAD(P)-binding protein [Didymosphaeria enalia]
MPVDPSKDLLLVTCALGKQEVIQTDIYSPSNCVSLMKDVTVAIHIGPSYHAHETEIGYMMIDAAVSAYDNGKGKFEHFILSSVLNSQLRKMMNHDCKRYVEEYIMESGLPYTILQPTTFMDNLPIAMFMQQEHPKFTSAWNTEVGFSWIALRDLAEVFARILAERERHFYAQYPLVSTHDRVSFGEALNIISKKLNKRIEIAVTPFKESVDNILVRLYGKSESIGQRSKDAAQRMIMFYDNRGLVGNANVLEWVLGRKATQFDEWVEMRLEVESKSRDERLLNFY